MAKQKTTPESPPDDRSQTSPKKRQFGLKVARRSLDRRQRAILRHIRKFLVQRRENLRIARRETIGWLLLVTVLVMVGYLQAGLFTRSQTTVAAADGGTYAEGVVDKIATINPLYLTTEAEQAASGLVYAGLLDFDSSGALRPELAMSYTVSSDGKTYDVKLRDNVRWSDGQPFSADDVVLTLGLIKDPAVGSTLFEAWKNIGVKKIGQLAVAFTLKNAQASFPLLWDFGILPAHILKDVKPADVKTTFTNNPAGIVGSGPFVYSSEEVLDGGQTVFKLAANPRYFRGAPRLSAVTIRTYPASSDLLKGFQSKEINAAAGLGVSEAAEAVRTLSLTNASLAETPLGDGVFALFNNSGEITSNGAIREALRLGVDRSALRAAVTAKSQLKTVTALETPLTPGLIADVDKLKQPGFDPKAAGAKLDAAGWPLNTKGQRVKDGQPLTLNIVTVKGADYEPAAKNLAEQWRKLGITVELNAADPATVQQNFLIPRAYDVLVYQLHLGNDPDVSAYWTSLQATARGSNFANYRSKLADVVLGNARVQSDAGKRAAGYTYFVEHYWLPDAPAIALYQPNYYYLTAENVKGFDGASLFRKSARLTEVNNFTVNVDQFKVTP